MNHTEMLQELVNGGHDRYRNAPTSAPKQKRFALTERALKGLMAAIGNVISAYVSKSLAPLTARQDEQAATIAQLQATVAELKQHLDAMRHCGPWSGDEKYVRGNSVSHGGSTWWCQRDTTAKPGTNDDWTLAAKRGRDGRDADHRRGP